MLKINHLKKNYGSFNLDCSIEVLPGYVTGLVGKNGAGKSTTFKAILGLIKIDDGVVEVFGKNSETLTPFDKENIGVVLSDSSFSQYLTIQDLLPILKHLYRRFDQEYFLNQCYKFSLPLKKPIKEFSSGMKAKLKILVALGHRPKLLILDEPTAGLDVLARDEVLEMLREFMEEDETRSILMSSHISSDLESICDDLYIIHDGKIILHEQLDSLLGNYAILKVDESQWEELDKTYLMKYKKESYGYCCLTAQKQFYLDNYPSIVIENGHIDDLMLLMIKGGK